MKASDIIGVGKKRIYKNMRFAFKVPDFAIECDTKYERLDPKKIMPFEEYEQKDGKRVVKKLEEV